MPIDHRALAELLAEAPELPPYARGWRAEGTAKKPLRSAPNERRHRRLAAEGDAAALVWIGHPAVRERVEAARPDLRAIAAPLWMYDPETVVFVTARMLQTRAIYSDGSEWPDAYEGATESFNDQMRLLEPRYVAALEALASDIAKAGAALDPADLGSLLLLAQLVHLEIDWDLGSLDLIGRLTTWPPGWVRLPEAERGHVATVISRHGRRTRFQVDLAGAAEVIVRRIGPAAISRPYAGGRRRARPALEHRRDERRDALRRVIETFPDVTAGMIHRTWGEGITTPGGMLRAGMALQPIDRPPSLSTLRADLRELG